MKIWLTHVAELLPIDRDGRLFRYGILSDMLCAQGHCVTRWSPTFNHFSKRQRCLNDKTIEVKKDYRIELLYAPGYNRNISLARIRFHYQIARAIERRMNQEPPPDIILSGIPTPEMCLVALRYAHKHGIPLVMDVRDLWPDIYLTLVPKAFHCLARLALLPKSRTNRHIFGGAAAIFGVSETYLNWGLGFAGRDRCQADGVFPLGYPEPSYSEKIIVQEKERLIEFGVDENKAICCYFGQFEASCDLFTVIDAARILEKDGYKDVQFVLCGAGTKLQAVRERSSGLRNVILPGWVSAPTIHALMQMSKIGLAAYAEGAPQSLPNKPIEYLAGGLVVVSSLTGELENILSGECCGITYQAGDVHALVDVIRFLVEHPGETSRMRRKARAVFEDRFSVNRVYPVMIERLERIAKGELGADGAYGH
jgi:glycosyltransferase involved in cell wall biosynthesis